MKQRCNNPRHTAARWYHDRGIRVCAEWNNSFLTFQSWALSNGYEPDLSIDRINPDGDYCASNCRWIPMRENVKRARKFAGARTVGADIQCRPKSGRYEVWDVTWGLCARVVKVRLIYREAKELAGILQREQPRKHGGYVVKKVIPPHAENEFIVL